jgi:serine phosphatase RsbU (regulator of sigma subunit)
MAPPRPRARRSPWSALFRILWTLPLLALPFAGFFMLVGAAPWRAFPVYWQAAMIFAAPIGFANWALGQFVSPAIARRFPGDVRTTWWIAGMHVAGSLLASIVSIVLLGLTLVPTFLTQGRSIVVALTYSGLFAALFMGAALAFNFYRQALAHAGADRELLLARRIQRSFLLTEFPRRPRLDVHAVNLSSKEVSGDFYDVVQAADDALVLAVADVSGKGVPAALLSSMIQASLRTQAGGAASPAAMTSIINTLACQRDSTGQFATLFLAVVDEATLTLRFTNAGHNFPVLASADGTQRLLETGGLLAGMIPGVPYEEGSVRLSPGDRLVVYTDGVTEAANAAGEMFGEERLYALLRSLPPGQDARHDVESVLAAVGAFLGETEAGDDITVLVLRVPDGPTAGAPA